MSHQILSLGAVSHQIPVKLAQWFTLQAQQAVRYDIIVTLLDLDDSVLELYDTDRTTQLAQNDDFQNTLASALDWTCPA